MTTKTTRAVIPTPAPGVAAAAAFAAEKAATSNRGQESSSRSMPPPTSAAAVISARNSTRVDLVHPSDPAPAPSRIVTPSTPVVGPSVQSWSSTEYPKRVSSSSEREEQKPVIHPSPVCNGNPTPPVESSPSVGVKRPCPTEEPVRKIQNRPSHKASELLLSFLYKSVDSQLCDTGVATIKVPSLFRRQEEHAAIQEFVKTWQQSGYNVRVVPHPEGEHLEVTLPLQ